MSERDMWKMIHLLYNLRPGKKGINTQELNSAGIICDPDTISPLVNSGVVIEDAGTYSLSIATGDILRSCVVANRRWPSGDMKVDYPLAFVIMPFKETWSDIVFKEMIEPGITEAGLTCIRGDYLVRVGDLTRDIWDGIMQAGLIVADVSSLNANVFYELGLVHALGKETIVLKQSGSNIPADIGGIHYYEYSLDALDDGKTWLRTEITIWAQKNYAWGVKLLLGG